MTTTIVDLTSLVELCQITKEKSPKIKGNGDGVCDVMGGGSGIEAIVLFDNVLVDKAAFLRARESNTSLRKLDNYIGFVNEQNSDVRLCYEESVEFILAHANTQDSFIWNMLDEFIAKNSSQLGSSLGSVLPMMPFMALMLHVRNKIFRTTRDDFVRRNLCALNISIDEVSDDNWLGFMRLFYYLFTQKNVGVHLSLHPSRAKIINSGIRKADPLFTMAEAVSKNIVSHFDSEVRQAYVARREAWLGDGDRHINLPILTNYIASACRMGSDPIEAALDLRESSEAKRFRKEVSNLVVSLGSGKHIEADKILSRLDIECKKWSIDLAYNPSKSEHALGVTVPFVGISIDVPFLAPKIRRRPGDAILIFLHKLISSVK